MILDGPIDRFQPAIPSFPPGPAYRPRGRRPSPEARTKSYVVASSESCARRLERFESSVHPSGNDDGARAYRSRQVLRCCAAALIADPGEKAADILELRRRGGSLMYIRDVVRERGFQISHEHVVRRILVRRAPEQGAAR